MTTMERIQFFEQNYDLIFGELIDKGDKKFIGGEGDVTCRFCGRNKSEVTFSNTAHAIPEFLGNKQIILKEECDECNTKFSNQLENHLDKFTKPYRTFAQIKGKNKVPNYKTKDKKSRIDFNANEGLKITDRVDSKIAEIDEENKTIQLNPHLEPYIPTAVYKCLVKIALSVIPRKELAEFDHAIHWISDRDHSKKLLSPQIVLSTFVPGPRPNKQLAVFVLRRKQSVNSIPFCIFVIGFGNFVYQIMVPSIRDSKNKNTTRVLTIPRFPTPFENGWAYGKPQYGQIDLSSHEVIADKNAPMIFRYENVQKIKMGN